MLSFYSTTRNTPIIGIDQDDDEYVESGSQDDGEEESEMEAAAAAAERSKEAEREIDQMAKAETKELEAAKKERMELLAAEQTVLANEHKVPNQGKATLEEKFHYLVSQSEVFAHFLAGEFFSLFGSYFSLRAASFVGCQGVCDSMYLSFHRVPMEA